MEVAWRTRWLAIQAFTVIARWQCQLVIRHMDP
jgi:hypothetical protein